MRISVDASPLLLRSAGVKNYLYHWIAALQARSGDHEVFPYPFINDIGELTHEHSVMSLMSTAPRIACLFASNRFASVRKFASRSANVFHVTNQVHSGVRGAALTATVHDLTCWLTPEFHTPANIQADRRFAERILTQADGLIAVSENSRQDAIRILNIKPEKIQTIHSGVAQPYFDVDDLEAATVAESLDLRKPFVLHIGTVEPRKNLDALLDAYLLLPASMREAFDLVLAGPLGWADSTTSKRILSGLPGVKYLGYVPERQLPGLTRAAALFAYPSLYEGFGFPVAQAMAAGVPVLTSNNSCLPEIAGPGALLIDPRSPGEIKSGLDRLLSSPDLRSSLGAAGRRHAQNYHWQRCAEQSWSFFLRYA
jgi:glycosyltransferase involved in cell wall biosynthesis